MLDETKAFGSVMDALDSVVCEKGSNAVPSCTVTPSDNLVTAVVEGGVTSALVAKSAGITAGVLTGVLRVGVLVDDPITAPPPPPPPQPLKSKTTDKNIKWGISLSHKNYTR